MSANERGSIMESGGSGDPFGGAEEQIAVGAFRTAEALKREIGERLQRRLEHDWDFVALTASGPYLTLKFRLRGAGQDA